MPSPKARKPVETGVGEELGEGEADGVGVGEGVAEAELVGLGEDTPEFGGEEVGALTGEDDAPDAPLPPPPPPPMHPIPSATRNSATSSSPRKTRFALRDADASCSRGSIRLVVTASSQAATS